jgi:hypothetical protein
MGEAKIRRQRIIDAQKIIAQESILRNEPLIISIEQEVAMLTGDEGYYFNLEDRLKQLKSEVNLCQVFLSKSDGELHLELSHRRHFRY